MTASALPWWAAPVAAEPIQAVVHLPGSKSHTNRYLVLAALAGSPTIIDNPLQARDTTLMVQALQQLGADIATTNPGSWIVTAHPAVGGDHQPQRSLKEIDCGLAGTVMRFGLVVAALTPGQWRFDGDTSARLRPLAPLVRALRHLGVDLSGDHLPVTLAGGRHRGGVVQVDASASSQFLSALLLAGCRFEQAVTLRHVGAQPPPSQPYLDMSVEVLRQAGIEVTQPDACTWSIPPGLPHLGRVQVEPDLSNAAPFLAAALVTGGQVSLPQWPHRTSQPGAQLPDLLRQMGAQVKHDDAGLHVQGPEPGLLRPLQADLRAVGELTPVLAALCALSEGSSTLRGIGHLRGHETDRLAAIGTEWGRLGVPVEVLPDGLRIHGRAAHQLHPAPLLTYADHRMATAAAVFGLVIPGIQVQDVACVGKTMPDFPDRWSAMLGRA